VLDAINKLKLNKSSTDWFREQLKSTIYASAEFTYDSAFGFEGPKSTHLDAGKKILRSDISDILLANTVIAFGVFVIDDIVDDITFVKLLEEDASRKNIVEDTVRIFQSLVLSSKNPAHAAPAFAAIEAKFSSSTSQKMKNGMGFMIILTKHYVDTLT